MKIPSDVLRQMKKYPPFYQKTWITCSRIPKGKTVSYGELAEMIGHPGAARAVGQAMAKNPFAPVIPCHRVIRSDGSLGGYSAAGGIKRKREMLEKEKRK